MRTALWLGLAPFATTALGFLLGLPWLLPILGAAPAFPVFLGRIRAGRPGRAFRWMMFWVIFQSAAVGTAVALFPERASEVVLTGPGYTEEMLHWARTGEGPEGSPRLFLPLHARHFAGFCALTLLTAGGAALALGTWLLNYMNYYVAMLARESVHTALAASIGWPPWAVLRVAGFVAAAVGLTPWSLRLWARVLRGPAPDPKPARFYLFVGLALVVADAVLKAAMAPLWQRWVAFALDGR